MISKREGELLISKIKTVYDFEIKELRARSLVNH